MKKILATFNGVTFCVDEIARCFTIVITRSSPASEFTATIIIESCPIDTSPLVFVLKHSCNVALLDYPLFIGFAKCIIQSIPQDKSFHRVINAIIKILYAKAVEERIVGGDLYWKNQIQQSMNLTIT